jgi:pyruvate/2-oxoacid:ferredoxin oxidoreductase alpha subunit
MEIGKVMVFKDRYELPGAFKFLEEYIPKSREKVVVIDQEQSGEEIYLNVRFSGSGKAKLNARYFRTIPKDKLRSKLLGIKVRNEKVEALLKTL